MGAGRFKLLELLCEIIRWVINWNEVNVLYFVLPRGLGRAKYNSEMSGSLLSGLSGPHRSTHFQPLDKHSNLPDN